MWVPTEQPQLGRAWGLRQPLLSSTLWPSWETLKNRGTQSSHFSKEAGNLDS